VKPSRQGVKKGFGPHATVIIYDGKATKNRDESEDLPLIVCSGFRDKSRMIIPNRIVSDCFPKVNIEVRSQESEDE
jgi:hypothetical protein